MSKKLGLFLSIVILIVLAVVFAWQYINKESKDYIDAAPSASFSVVELLEKTTTDTNSISKLIDQLVVVHGKVKNIKTDSTSITIELGDSISMSSIICQIDNRHQADFTNKQINEDVSIKGKLTGFTIDDELGLGNTIQMNYCSLNKK